jgi:Cytosolic domain of 10TM putative phosphate transporter
MKIFSDTF